jgi:hypothetical protein
MGDNTGMGDSTGWVTILVPINELVFDLTGLFVIPPNITFPNLLFKSVCAFGIMFNLQPPPYSTTILGDTFLRSSYMVYDLKNNLIGIVQTNFNSTISNAVEFQANATGIPDVKGVVSSVSGTTTATRTASGSKSS